MTRKDKIEMREQFIIILNKIADRNKPCEDSYENAEESTKLKEFYKATNLYSEIKELTKTLEKMNEYSNMLDNI